MNKDTSLPLVTIITVAYNSVSTIEQTIVSVINQSYKNIEYIIIDGGSTDGTVDIIKKYAEHIDFWVSEKDSGIYYAMNKGLNKANGFLVGILNSDDWYEPNAIEHVVKNYQDNPTTEVIHGLLRFIGSNGLADSIVGHYSNFLNSGMIEHPTCFIRKELYDKVGPFNIDYKSAADYEWMLRARNNNAKFLFVPEVLTNFRRGGMSDSTIGFSEELLIKKRFKIISKFKYLYWKLYVQTLTIIKSK
ncbi:glycosyltransferase family 2 protein [Pedobacter sp.]|uniref:glycosyltransferase family 2 protein n=1 Tax=Pedobacter sp. TaxID=1411316 RepID=UPI003D7F8555